MNLLVSTEFSKWLWVVTGNRYYIQCDVLVEVGVFVKDGGLLGVGWEELYKMSYKWGGWKKGWGNKYFLKRGKGLHKDSYLPPTPTPCIARVATSPPPPPPPPPIKYVYLRKNVGQRVELGKAPP